MKLRFLGAHNAESQNTRYVSILINDDLIFDAGCITTELTFEEQKKISAILLSHGHFDHIQSVPTYAFSNYSKTTKIFASKETHNILNSHLIDGLIYPKFYEKISFSDNKPLDPVTITDNQSFSFLDYNIRAIPVNHIKGSLGFEIFQKNGKKLFYTGDTGSNLNVIWNEISPDILIIDVTFPNRLNQFANNSKHLCPSLLEKELDSFLEINGYLPRIFAIHLSPRYSNEISKEINSISDSIGHTIEIASEGQKLSI